MSRLFFALSLFAALPAGAHTLPISYLTLVPDAEYLHLELTLNPFELNSFSELDKNRNGRIDSDEIASSQEKLTRQILGALTLRVDGSLVSAEIAGIEPDSDSHHLTLRGQYRVDARGAKVAIESRLSSIMGMSHLTQVTVLRNDQEELAQLDAHWANAEFAASQNAKDSRPTRNNLHVSILPLFGLALLVWAMLAGLLLLVIRQQIRRAQQFEKLKPAEAL